jgi:hypothetical protein
MFKRIFVEEWMLMVPIISFVIFAVVFAAVTWRALRISKSEREHLAALPLDDTPPNSHSR